MKAILLATLAAFALATPVLAGPAEDSVGNGHVMMIHTHLEPKPALPVPPVGEAAVATREGDSVVFHAIPFSIETGRPALAFEPSLEITDALGESFTVTPNASPAGRAVCEEETGLPGHEGPLAACLVFVVDAAAFAGKEAVTLTLRWENADGTVSYVETYNAVAHGLLHSWMEGAPVTLEQADGFADPTPVVVEHAVDPVA